MQTTSEKEKHEVVPREEVETIGGSAEQKQEIAGKPITPQDAAEAKSEAMMAGEPTGKGSLPARMEAAAAFNVREHVVPPVGTKETGTERDKRVGKGEGKIDHRHIEHGGKKYA
ncbi:unnamed protein product [Closterium sp. Yama58-4]|nr:unnamed protein product [Closterium sp. Yama58-4]